MNYDDLFDPNRPRVKVLKVPNNMVAVLPLYDSDNWNKESRIIRPSSTKERCDQGIVKYKGKDVSEDIQIGDHVFFSGYVGTLMELEDEGRMIFLPQDFIQCKVEREAILEVPGLYFRDSSGEYFPATYEMGIELMKDAVQHSPYFNRIDVNGPKPTVEELGVRGSWKNKIE